ATISLSNFTFGILIYLFLLRLVGEAYFYFRLKTNIMKEYGLIGKSLSHSFSPAFFNEKFKKDGLAAHYNIYEIAAIKNVKILLDKTKIAGFNVTIPYKSEIIPFL